MDKSVLAKAFLKIFSGKTLFSDLIFLKCQLEDNIFYNSK